MSDTSNLPLQALGYPCLRNKQTQTTKSISNLATLHLSPTTNIVSTEKLVLTTLGGLLSPSSSNCITLLMRSGRPCLFSYHLINSVRTVARNGHFSITVWGPLVERPPVLISIWGDDEEEAEMQVIGRCTTIVNENNLKS